MMKRLRLAIINCSSTDPELYDFRGRLYDSGYLLEQNILHHRLSSCFEQSVFSPFRDDKDFPKKESYDAVLMPGSKLDIHRGGRYANPWMERLLEFITETADMGIPMLGICFGHQAMAVAFGSELVTVPSPINAEVGYVPVSLTADGERDPMFKGVPGVFDGLQFHFHCIMDPPKSATVLARGQETGIIQSFRIGRSAWAVQFHPDYSESNVSNLVKKKSGQLSRFVDLSGLKLKTEKRYDVLVLDNFLEKISSQQG